MTLLIRPENAAERDAIWEVNQLKFGGEAASLKGVSSTVEYPAPCDMFR